MYSLWLKLVLYSFVSNRKAFCSHFDSRRVIWGLMDYARSSRQSMRCLDFGTISQKIELPDQLRKNQFFEREGFLLLLRGIRKGCRKKSQNYDKISLFFEFVLFLTTSIAGIAFIVYIFFIWTWSSLRWKSSCCRKPVAKVLLKNRPCCLVKQSGNRCVGHEALRKMIHFFDSEGRGWIKGYKILELGTLGLLAKVGS